MPCFVPIIVTVIILLAGFKIWMMFVRVNLSDISRLVCD